MEYAHFTDRYAYIFPACCELTHLPIYPKIDAF